MPGVNIEVFLTFSELTGQRPVEADFIRALSSFSQQSILRLCAFLTLTLETWIRGAQTEQMQSLLLSKLFPPRLALELTARLWALPEDKRTVIHRRALLLVCKMAILHCPSRGLDALTNNRVGMLFLAANDFLDAPVDPALLKPIQSHKELVGFIAMMLVIGEYSHRMPAQALARSRRMLLEIPNKLSFDNDLQQEFEREAGLSLDMYFAMSIASLAHFHRFKGAKWLSNFDQSVLVASNLNMVGTSPDIVNTFLSLISSSPNKLKDHRYSKTLRRNDMTIFRDSPFVEMAGNFGQLNQTMMFIPIDLEFMMEKLTNGPYWLLKGRVADFDSRYWGRIFEAYCGDVLLKACVGTNQRVFCAPRYADGAAEEISDAIILASDTLVLLEFKTCMMDVASKYDNDVDRLESNLRKLLIGSVKKPKAILQHIRAVKSLFGSVADRRQVHFDLAAVKRCYCLTVTLDYIGGSPGVATFLNSVFEEELKDMTLDIRPVGSFSMNVEELEWITGLFASETLATSLQKWKDLNPPLGTPISALDFERDWIEPDWLRDDYEALYDNVTKTFFPSELKQRQAPVDLDGPHDFA